MDKKQDPKRRDFLKKAAYSAPAILTLQAASGVAKAGSEKPATGSRRNHPSRRSPRSRSASTAHYSLDRRARSPVSTRMSERGIRY